MLQLRFVSFAILIYLLNLQPYIVEGRPSTQKILVHGHEWTVPDGPGWDEVLHEAEQLRQNLLNNCANAHDCRLAAEKLRQLFLNHPVSAQYFNGVADQNNDHLTQSIFRWG